MTEILFVLMAGAVVMAVAIATMSMAETSLTAADRTRLARILRGEHVPDVPGSPYAFAIRMLSLSVLGDRWFGIRRLVLAWVAAAVGVPVCVFILRAFGEPLTFIRSVNMLGVFLLYVWFFGFIASSIPTFISLGVSRWLIKRTEGTAIEEHALPSLVMHSMVSLVVGAMLALGTYSLFDFPLVCLFASESGWPGLARIIQLFGKGFVGFTFDMTKTVSGALRAFVFVYALPTMIVPIVMTISLVSVTIVRTYYRFRHSAERSDEPQHVPGLLLTSSLLVAVPPIIVALGILMNGLFHKQMPLARQWGERTAGNLILTARTQHAAFSSRLYALDLANKVAVPLVERKSKLLLLSHVAASPSGDSIYVNLREEGEGLGLLDLATRVYHPLVYDSSDSRGDTSITLEQRNPGTSARITLESYKRRYTSFDVGQTSGAVYAVREVERHPLLHDLLMSLPGRDLSDSAATADFWRRANASELDVDLVRLDPDGREQLVFPIKPPTVAWDGWSALGTWDGTGLFLNSVAVSPDEQVFVIWGSRGWWVVDNAADSQFTIHIPDGYRPRDACFAPDGHAIAATVSHPEDHTFAILLASAPHYNDFTIKASLGAVRPTGLAWSSDGKFLLVTGDSWAGQPCVVVIDVDSSESQTIWGPFQIADQPGATLGWTDMNPVWCSPRIPTTSRGTQ